jgi:hypothetical protein
MGFDMSTPPISRGPFAGRSRETRSRASPALANGRSRRSAAVCQLSAVSVMSRAPRFHVRYDQHHSRSTATRFLKPMRKKMWTRSQASQANNPLSLSPRMSATAAARPMVASDPLSRQRNGARGRPRKLRTTLRAACFPS